MGEARVTYVVGHVADLLTRMCNAASVVRVPFNGGSRYMVKFGALDVEVHMLVKGNELFIEFWTPNFATPVIIIYYQDVHRDPLVICREICAILSSLWGARAGP